MAKNIEELRDEFALLHYGVKYSQLCSIRKHTIDQQVEIQQEADDFKFDERRELSRQEGVEV